MDTSTNIWSDLKSSYS